MTRLSLNDLLPDTTYAIRIRAVGVTGVSEWSTRRLFNTIGDTVSPSIPSSVTWVSTGDSFHGEWNAVDTNVNGDPIVVTRYEVELMANGVTKVDSLAAATGSKVIYDLSLEANRALFGSPRGAIELRVRAVDNKNLKSDWTSGILATNPRPANVTNLTGVVGVDQITLKWDAVADADVARYEVYVGSASNFTPAAANRVFSGLATTFSYTTATYAAHYFKVRAVDKFEQTSLADTTSAALTPVNPFNVDSTPPAVPSALAATVTNNANGQGAKASVSWTLGSETDRSYVELSYKRASDSIWTSVVLGKDQASTIIDLASAYTAYDFRVRAADASANTSAFSSTLSKPAVVPGTPTTVTGFGSTAGKDSIVYKWTANTESDIKNYEVTFSTTSDFSAGNITYFTGTANSLTVSGLNTNTPYYARVRATNQNNQSSAFSATNTATTGVYPTNTGPQGPAGPAGADGTDGLDGADGSAGPSGRGISSTEVTYQVSSSGTTAPTGTWLTTVPTVAAGQFLWTKLVINYTDALNPTTSYAVARTGTNGTNGTSVTSIIPYFAQVATGTTPANPSGVTPATPWTSTEPTYVPNTELFRSERILFSSSATPTYTSVQKVSSYAAATAAVASSNGVNRNFWSLVAASGTSLNGRNFVNGDTWWQRDSNGKVIAQWEYIDGTTWSPRQVSHQMISSIDVGTATVLGKLKAGNIDVSTGGDNLVRDSGFEGGTALIENYSGSSSVAVSSVEVYRGTKSLATTPGASPRGVIVWSQPMEAQYEIPAGENFVGSLLFKGVAGAQYSVSFRLRNATSSYIGEGFGGLSVTANGAWQRIITGVYAHNAKCIPGIQIVQQQGTSTSPFYVDTVKIELGDLASGYSPRADEVLPGTIKGEYLEANTSLVNILNIGTGGFIQSAGYNPAGTTGFRLSGTELTIKSGVITADAVRSGNLGGPAGTNSVIQISAGTSLIMNGGYIKSNTNAGTTMATAVSSGAGFYLGTDGLFIGGGANGGQVKVDALISGSLSGHTLTLANGGAINFTGTGQITATGFILNSAGLTLSQGASITGAASVDAAAVKTGELRSNVNATINGATQPVWSVNLGGYARFTGMSVLGTTVLGNSATDTASILQSSNYLPGSAGWMIRGDGLAEFRNVVSGSLNGTAIAGDTLSISKLLGGNLSKIITLGTGSSIVANGLMGESVGMSSAGFLVTGPQETPVTQKSRTSNVATITTEIKHSFVAGSKVRLSTGDATFDGTESVTVTNPVTDTTFTYANVGANVATTATGGHVKGLNPNLNGTGPLYVSFPTNGDAPNIISGKLTASTLTVSEGMNISKSSTLERGAVLTINSTIQSPTVAPDATFNYSEINIGPFGGDTIDDVQAFAPSVTPGNYIVGGQGPDGYALVQERNSKGEIVADRYKSPVNEGAWQVVSITYTTSFSGKYYVTYRAIAGGQVLIKVRTFSTAWALLDTKNLTYSFVFSGLSSVVVGWDFTNSTLLLATRESYSASVTARSITLDTNGIVTGATGTAVPLNGTSSSLLTQGLAMIARGSFDLGVDSYVLRVRDTVAGSGSTANVFANYFVTSNAGVETASHHWPTANGSKTHGGFWNTATSKFIDITPSGNVRTYEGGDSRWVGTIMTSNRWVRYSWFKNSIGATGLSPADKVILPKRARLTATISPIPYDALGSGTPDQAKVYVLDSATDGFPALTNYKLRATVTQPSQLADINPNSIGAADAVASTANAFASQTGTPGGIYSSSGLSYWKGDDTAQFKALRIVSGGAEETSYGVMSADAMGATIESYVNSTGTRGGFEIKSNYTLMNVAGGKVLIDSDTNIQARVASGATALVLAGFGAAITQPDMNSSNPNAANTRNLHVNTLYAYGDVRASTGLFDVSYAGQSALAASYNTNGRVIRGGTSSLRYKKYVRELGFDEASKALNLRSVSFEYKSGMEMWVNRDNEGRPDALRYSEFTAAHNVLIRDLYEKNEVLENEVSELNRRLSELENLVNSMVNTTN